jgi:hypothetical protein
VRSDGSAWEWVREVYPGGLCLSFAEGRAADEMIAAFGVEPAAAAVLTLPQAREEFEDDPNVFRAGETGGWGFLVEEFSGDHRAQLCELSTGRQGVSACWVSEKAMSTLAYYEDGREICHFEPDARYGGPPDPATLRFRPAMRRVGLGPDTDRDPAATSLVAATLDLLTVEFGIRLAAEQAVGPLLTGEVEIDMSWLDGPATGPG